MAEYKGSVALKTIEDAANAAAVSPAKSLPGLVEFNRYVGTAVLSCSGRVQTD